MNTNLSSTAPSKLETDCLVIVVLDRSEKDQAEKDKPSPSIECADAAVRDAAKDVIASGEVTAKLFETTLLHHPSKLKAKRLLLLGGGKTKNFSATELRKLAGAAVRTLKGKSIRNFALVLPGSAAPSGAAPSGAPSSPPKEVLPENATAENVPSAGISAPDAVRAIVEGAFIGDFDPGYYKSGKNKEKDQKIDTVTIVANADDKFSELEAALHTGRIIAESQNFTRDLVNEPSNLMTPTILAERAKKMASEVGLSCEVYGADKIRQLKMGAFWGVAQGSDEPPALIVLRYDPPGAAKDVHLGLVGKGVTFDTGGISIKPADGMEKMKYDMAGAATMIGTMRAIALLKPKVKVTAIILATENMPSGKAQKPGDVQIAMSGKSIEIINTDAEGRLILADGLSYARQLGCTHLVDAATLTGAIVVALGYVNAGIFASTDDMYERFSKANQQAGEKMWRMPIDDEYKELIKSNIADMVNAGSRYGGAIFAAMFLKEFAEDTPWVHLDIAGTAWMEDNKPWIAKGPSGIALRSLVEFVKGWNS
jgi:leucyl aminopeptidase